MKTPSINQYLSTQELSALCKVASEHPEKKRDWRRAAKVVGSGLLGMGVGTAAGAGGMELADYLYKKTHGGTPMPLQPLLIAAPALGGAAGLAYSLWKAKEREELNRAVQSSPDNKSHGQ